MSYIPKNIRNGVSINKAKEIAKNYTGQCEIAVISFDHGRDVCGNGTAHYICKLVIEKNLVCTVVESGKRREQVGYSGANESALYALEKLGYNLDLSKVSSYDYQQTAIYPIINW